MRRLYFLVEGPTEENVARELLLPHFLALGWQPAVSILKTKTPAAGPSAKGGVTGWNQIRRNLGGLLQSRPSLVTTLIDYYGLTEDVPGMNTRPVGDPYTRVSHVEKEMATEIDDHRFLPHLVLHELEAWVFAAADHLASSFGDPRLAERCKQDIEAAGSPELINEGRETAPSKRLLRYSPGYRKTSDGPAALAALGLEGLRQQCPHLNDWLRRIEHW